LLNSTIRNDNGLMRVESTNPDMILDRDQTVPKGTIHIQRDKFLLGPCCYEQITFANYGPDEVSFEGLLQFGADYRDIFEIRGMRRERRGEIFQPVINGREIFLSYRGLDKVLRSTRIELSFEPTYLDEKKVAFALQIPPKGRRSVETTCHFYLDKKRDSVAACSAGLGMVKATHETGKNKFCHVSTLNEPFNLWLERSRDDLVMMTTQLEADVQYPYAGIPWYCCPFGRDGIWTALLCLWANPTLGKGVLKFLAATQAKDFDLDSDAEPGKIVHEVRQGEMAALKEIPFGRYYGSVDSTPLFLVLAGRYFDRTGDLETVKSLWPNLLSALRWIEQYGDADGDGFVEYRSSSGRGLKHQGWKDSQDCIFHADGSDAEGPIALAEVQGYVYEAKSAMAKLAVKMGDELLARELTKEAEQLQASFDATFWISELGTYCMALDGKKRPCRVPSSNAGHCLYSGIVLPNRAATLISGLVSDSMFSGWGIRTIGTDSRRYNPMSYHNGSVWPHDSAIITLGFARYGFKREVEKIFNGLFKASSFMELSRLPEVYCGFTARDGDPPTLYPVACSPQAWASAAVYGMIQALLGIEFLADKNSIIFRKPHLPSALRELRLHGLHFGESVIDAIVKHYEEDVGMRLERLAGDVKVTVEK
jgi:glycogen debranching enzyme